MRTSSAAPAARGRPGAASATQTNAIHPRYRGDNPKRGKGESKTKKPAHGMEADGCRQTNVGPACMGGNPPQRAFFYPMVKVKTKLPKSYRLRRTSSPGSLTCPAVDPPLPKRSTTSAQTVDEIRAKSLFSPKWLKKSAPNRSFALISAQKGIFVQILHNFVLILLKKDLKAMVSRLNG